MIQLYKFACIYINIIAKFSSVVVSSSLWTYIVTLRSGVANEFCPVHSRRAASVLLQQPRTTCRHLVSY